MFGYLNTIHKCPSQEYLNGVTCAFLQAGHFEEYIEKHLKLRGPFKFNFKVLDKHLLGNKCSTFSMTISGADLIPFIKQFTGEDEYQPMRFLTTIRHIKAKYYSLYTFEDIDFHSGLMLGNSLLERKFVEDEVIDLYS